MSLTPTIIVLFGGAGDLVWRKLIPLLFDLYCDGRIPEPFAILAVDRLPLRDEDLRKRFLDGVKQFARNKSVKKKGWDSFARHVTYRQGDFQDPATYSHLETTCGQLEKAWKVKAGRIFHLATPPEMVRVIPKLLAYVGRNQNRLRDRIVVEKPLGHDLNSAQEMSHTLRQSFDEKQIFRINHYLGKETVQNILAFRFANPLFEPIWNRRYVDYVTITVAEKVGIGHRGGYYEHAGALRDMVQNHLMQVLCLVAMEPMVSFDTDEIRNKKVNALRPIARVGRARHGEIDQYAVRGQYGPGKIDGKKVHGYRQEESVSRCSRTETFATLKLFVDN